jgi:UDP-3-O-[3-hydroxymyristoyl] glucosamine N-acyltransferase
MKKIIIVGTGAVAAELTSYIADHNNHVVADEQISLIGYIDYAYNIEKYYKKYELTLPVLGDIDTYTIPNDTEVLIGVSDIHFKAEVIEKLLKRNVNFANFIHYSAILSTTIRMGVGNIIYPFCVIGPNVMIGDFNLVTSYSFISHDSTLGNNNFLSTAGIAGRVQIGNMNFFGIRSTILPNITIGDINIIQAGMTVDKDIQSDSTIFYRFKEKILAIPKS